MAVFSFGDFTTSPSALPTQYRELVANVQRLCPTLRTLKLENGVTGSAINFDVRIGGKTAAVQNLDGGNLLAATADQRNSVTLPYGEYGSAMQLTDKLRRVAPAIQGHDFLKNLMSQDLAESLAASAKYMNQQIYSGIGSAQQMNGLSNAVLGSGAYGGLTNSTYWVSTISEAGGSLRNLTLPMMRVHVSTQASAVGNTYGRPDLAFCKPGVFDYLLSLFTVNSNINMDSGNAVNPSKIYTSAGEVTRTGFRAFTWGSEQVTFIEDPDVTHTGSTNATNGIYFVSSGAIGLEQLLPGEMQGVPALSQSALDQMGPIAGLAFEMQPRGRTKAATEWDITAMLGLKVKCRAACGWLGDLNVAA